MINFKTNIQHLDEENKILFKASDILEQIGNDPNPTANEFYAQLMISDLPSEEHSDVILAAISIETMMNLDLGDPLLDEPTIH
jgi:hypothetical protein